MFVGTDSDRPDTPAFALAAGVRTQHFAQTLAHSHYDTTSWRPQYPSRAIHDHSFLFRDTHWEGVRSSLPRAGMWLNATRFQGRLQAAEDFQDPCSPEHFPAPAG